MAQIVGGCLCGAVRFEGELPALFCAHCHCNWCRRAHGAAFVTWLGVPETQFAIVSGADVIRWYASSEQSARPRARRGEAEREALSDRAFCTRCGTTMLFRSKLAPGEMHIALACLDDPTLAPPPKLHVFWEAHVSWVVLGDDLPRIDRDAPGLAKYKVIPRTP